MTPADELQAQHNQLALRLAMACTLTMAKDRQMDDQLAALCANELRRVAELTEESDLQLAAQMNSLAGHLTRR